MFVTAYDKYALEAFRVNAIGYILKPLSADDIAQTITRLKKVRPLPAPTQVPADRGRIYCLGRLLVYGADGKAVKWRTSKAEELFAFMLQNIGDEVSKWKIAQTIWPECDTEKLNAHLHTAVYTVKKTLLSASIKFDFTFTNGRYKLELPDAYIDAVEFEAITGAKIALSAASIDLYKKALSLYKGSYFEENGYLWSQSKTEEYSIRYRGLVADLAEYYLAKTDYASAEKILREALIRAPLDDDLNQMLLKLFFIRKDKPSLAMHYHRIKDLYQAELGIEPNAAMQELFDKTFEL